MSTEEKIERLGKILSFKNEGEIDEFRAEALHLDIMAEVRARMEELGMKKVQLAKALGTSKGYISQLFSGDRLVNIKTLAKLERILEMKWSVLYKAQTYQEPGEPDQSLLAAEPPAEYSAENSDENTGQ